MKLRNIVLAGAITLASFMPMKNVDAQLPFFTGQTPRVPTYALENRTMVSMKNPEFTNVSIVKTFRKEIPLWAYVGNAYNNKDGFGDFFYGVGTTINLGNRLYTLATLEGFGDKFSGVTFYSTLLLPKNFHIDFHPRLNSNLNYDFTSFNIGKTYKGLTFGISSNFKDGKIRDTDIRIARIRKGNFIDVGFNPGKKRIRIAFQKAF